MTDGLGGNDSEDDWFGDASYLSWSCHGLTTLYGKTTADGSGEKRILPTHAGKPGEVSISGAEKQSMFDRQSS